MEEGKSVLQESEDSWICQQKTWKQAGESMEIVDWNKERNQNKLVQLGNNQTKFVRIWRTYTTEIPNNIHT